MSDAASLLSLASTIAQGLIAIAGFMLSWVIWKSSKTKSKTEYMRSLQDGWMLANTTVLGAERLAYISDELFGHKRDGDEEGYHERRYVGFMYLNIIEAGYLGHKAGLVSDEYQSEIRVDMLKPLLRNPVIAKQIHEGGFNSGFVEYCEELLEEINAEKLPDADFTDDGEVAG